VIKRQEFEVKYHLFILYICLNLASCAITSSKHHYTGTKHNNKGAMRVVKTNDIQLDNGGIIYGNIQTYSRLEDIDINKILSTGKIDFKNKIKVRTFSNGNFIAENLKPGKYIISSIDTRNKAIDLEVLVRDVEFYSIIVRAGEAVYAGTYQIKVSKITGVDGKHKIQLLRSAVPTEKRILKHVSKIERDSIWGRSLRARMQLLI